MTRQRLLGSVLAGLSLLIAAPAAGAAEITFTITGKVGRDDVFVGGSGTDLIISPGVSVAASPATSGKGARCQPENDPLTGRPTLIRCDTSSPTKTGGAGFDLNADLRGADDSIIVSLGISEESVSILGGLGNDTINVAVSGTQALRGGDGDDTLGTVGTDTEPVTLDGGAGRDLAAYLGVEPIFQGPAGPCPTGGVTASLATGKATLLLCRPPDKTADEVRQDTLVAVERLSGTQAGDILTGGPGPDELTGGPGPDNLDGGDGNDALAGGDAADRLAGGNGTDTLDGGAAADVFLASSGGDTLISRDGVAERTSCLEKEIVVNDLVDSVDNLAGCASVSTAAAKHRFDTALTRRRLRLGPRRRVRVRVGCPEPKPDLCAGRLRLRLGGPRGKVLAARRYRLAPGEHALLPLALSAREAARVRGRAVTLDAVEVDGDGRDRRLIRRTFVRRPSG